MAMATTGALALGLALSSRSPRADVCRRSAFGPLGLAIGIRHCRSTILSKGSSICRAEATESATTPAESATPAAETGIATATEAESEGGNKKKRRWVRKENLTEEELEEKRKKLEIFKQQRRERVLQKLKRRRFLKHKRTLRKRGQWPPSKVRAMRHQVSKNRDVRAKKEYKRKLKAMPWRERLEVLGIPVPPRQPRRGRQEEENPSPQSEEAAADGGTTSFDNEDENASS